MQNTIIELREGDWAEMVTPRSARKMLIKLAWKAGDLSKYIFVDRSGKRVCELNDAELRKKMASGEIQAINQTGSRSANQNLSTLKRL